MLASAVVAIGVAALSTVGLSTDLFGRPPTPETVFAAAGQVGVIDGATLRLGLTVIRLDDILAFPRGEPCAAGPDCGGRATNALASLVRDRPVDCRLGARDRLGRALARCDAAGSDVNRDMVATGWARASSSLLAGAEDDARTHSRGLWAPAIRR